MIVVAKETSNKEHPFLEMFHREIDAYCGYKEWSEETDDYHLSRALEEMMEDEFLHAKFLRNYLKEHDMYNPDPTDEYEKKYLKIHKKYYPLIK